MASSQEAGRTAPQEFNTTRRRILKTLAFLPIAVAGKGLFDGISVSDQINRQVDETYPKPTWNEFVMADRQRSDLEKQIGTLRMEGKESEVQKLVDSQELQNNYDALRTWEAKNQLRNKLLQEDPRENRAMLTAGVGLLAVVVELAVSMNLNQKKNERERAQREEGI